MTRSPQRDTFDLECPEKRLTPITNPFVGDGAEHSLGAVSSTLHQKVKYPSGGQVLEIVGSQSMARQCLVTAIQHKPQTGATASEGNTL